jgi:hypothetical protein
MQKGCKLKTFTEGKEKGAKSEHFVIALPICAVPTWQGVSKNVSGNVFKPLVYM